MHSSTLTKLSMLFVLLVTTLHNADAECASKDWVQYKEAKCVRVLDLLTNHPGAELTCQEYNSTLLSITSFEEQEFLGDLLYSKLGVFDNVWLGAARVNSTATFQWTDGSPWTFDNWKEGSPSNIQGNDCVQMVPLGGRKDGLINFGQNSSGLWSDAACERRNLVVCQRRPGFSVDDLTALFFQHLQWSEAQHGEQDKQIADAKKELKELRTELAATKTDLNSTKTELTKTKTELNATKTDLTATKTELNATKIELGATKTDLSKTKTELNATKTDLSATKTDLSATKTDLSATKTDLTKTKTELNATKIELGATKTDLTAAKTELTKTKTELNATKTELTATKTELAATKTGLADAQSKIAQVDQDFKNLQKNSVPLGFIYTQLPGQPEPSALWPTVGWTQVTQDYAGLFFRAEGSESLPFGQVQNGQSPRLSRVVYGERTDKVINPRDIGVPEGGASEYIFTGSDNLYPGSTQKYFTFFLSFHNSGGEVRPRNQAVRLWKRTA